ncbi:hypothetical protein GIB67_042390 [Kingdonia uniflora]|uniref:Uncharacterized protein n=1 Tax=Kingdonia uniflora TaxID=39325 RepID=A0A7J7M843_9MAGN|nr:hypothetical protein GIB67_042390 [Kingdonia uniflora]
MSLLQTITKAALDSETLTSQSKYPIVLNSDEILLNLKPSANDDSNDTYLIKCVQGWKISNIESEIIELGNKFLKKLKRKAKEFKGKSKNPNFNVQDEFLGLFNSFLVKNGNIIGVSVELEPSDKRYTCVLVEKLGFLIGEDLAGLILDVCVNLEIWDLLETLIVNGVRGHLSSTSWIESLAEKKRSDLLCVCVKHIGEVGASNFLTILKYFLSPPKGSEDTMSIIRKQWENQALLAIEKVTNARVMDQYLDLAKQASILLMISYDGFSSSELCMHYLFASPNVDELILSYSLSRLDGSEMFKLIQYLGKWLRKYERFPRAIPCVNAASVLGLDACDWVPSLVSIVKSLGLVFDDHFLSLVLSSEYHEELRSIEGIVKSLSSEARLCCSVTDVVENLVSGI